MTGAPASIRERFVALVERLQDRYVAGLERLDGGVRFGRDAWQRPGGGGGVTRAAQDGEVIERAGANVSVVHGTLSDRLAERLGARARGFFAAGLSTIVHPRSPLAPTAHMNIRYFETEDGDAWFGGGADLTPHYLFEEDARHFHRVLGEACDRFAPDAYARFKEECDRYFWIRHRGEARGVGGIFFDELRGEPERSLELAAGVGEGFLEAYLPIVERRRSLPWGERERHWQELRRGRYVEFNLVYDRGTLFGLETDGRIESILVSMPPVVRWQYAHEPEPGSPEAALVEVLRRPRSWR